ncbi:hypothetical protein HXV90_18285 [Lysinibacillus sp. JK80]|uniref:hypothetical protein n=1 Tax=Lysinibacillus sp. JK80 TaxID=2749809 RepID=UPI0022B98FC3|nr:hypothetical protein [Lysinibacillus sp. JK80]WBF57631.1 hypothetical protein HXV90_18285 [Lysinibacillus sp. JK80]
MPKAPTPMTAALTKISYGDRFEAEIVFYDENDWNIIQHNAHLADRFLRELYEQEMEKSAYAMDFEQFCVFKKDDVPKNIQLVKSLLKWLKK